MQVIAVVLDVMNIKIVYGKHSIDIGLLANRNA